MVSRTIRSADADGDSIAATVIDLVEAIRGVESVALNPPLYDVVDPEALDALFTPSSDLGTDVGYATFWYQGCRVLVSSGGRVTVEAEPARRYHLRCVDCDFEMLLDGTSAEAFGTATDHQAAYGPTDESHFVEFTREESNRAADDVGRATD